MKHWDTGTLSKNLEWDRFSDNLVWDYDEYTDSVIAYLVRKYIKDDNYIINHTKSNDNGFPYPLPIVAKGISAYLSSEHSLDTVKSRLKHKQEIHPHQTFEAYYNKCFNFLKNKNNIIPLPFNRKSELELVNEHLETEKRNLSESEPLFVEIKDWEKETIAYIKQLAEYYQDWVKTEHLHNNWPETISPQFSKESTNNQKSHLTITQIALLYVYKGDLITKENGNEIAFKYGHKSGDKLYQKFSWYSSVANRKAIPDPLTKKKLQNKIDLIESIIEILPNDKQGRAKDEVSILKNKFETEYS